MGKPPMTAEAAERYLAEQTALPLGDCGRWHGFGIERAGELVGEIGFYLQTSGDEADLGYVLRPDVHGRGYATEAAQAMVSYAFDALGLEKITAHCDEANASSWRVMERLGMRRLDAEPGRAYAIAKDARESALPERRVLERESGTNR